MELEVIDRMSPYYMPQPPTSPGRAPLARAYLHYCTLEWGYSGEEVAAFFEARRDCGVPGEVSSSTRLFGELLARGDIRSWARPFGGGEPVTLKPTIWELDDYVDRFADSALNLPLPFDPAQSPTHWIFVDLDDWNRVVEECLGFAMRPEGRAIATSAADARSTVGVERSGGSVVSLGNAQRLIRLPEVVERTGLSKPTIYRRMRVGRFPLNTLLDGNMAVWRESEITAWIADPC